MDAFIEQVEQEIAIAMKEIKSQELNWGMGGMSDCCDHSGRAKVAGLELAVKIYENTRN
jgi:hypothetical protein